MMPIDRISFQDRLNDKEREMQQGPIDDDQQRLLLGIDVGGTHIRAALVSAKGVVVGPFLDEKRDQETVAHVQRLFFTLAAAAQQIGKPVTAIGVGLAGVVSLQQMVACSSLHDLKGLHVREEIEELTSLPVYLHNDAHAAGYAEWLCGAGRGSSSCVALFIGTGVGGAIILDGRLYSGKDGIAAGLGHLALDPNGPFCSCGGRGCLEQLASGPAIVRLAQQEIASGKETQLRAVVKERGMLTGEALASAARQDDPVALAVYERAGEWIGIALVNLANVLNVEQFVLGGGVMVSAGEFILPALMHVKNRCILPLQQKHLRIVQGKLGR
jgi:glucokinase